MSDSEFNFEEASAEFAHLADVGEIETPASRAPRWRMLAREQMLDPDTGSPYVQHMRECSEEEHGHSHSEEEIEAEVDRNLDNEEAIASWLEVNFFLEGEFVYEEDHHGVGNDARLTLSLNSFGARLIANALGEWAQQKEQQMAMTALMAGLSPEEAAEEERRYREENWDQEGTDPPPLSIPETAMALSNLISHIGKGVGPINARGESSGS